MTLVGILAGVVGLFVGSFLGLVAHRLPMMLERRYDASQHTDDGARSAQGAGTPRFDLLQPPSHCPACGHCLGILENIPLLSWLAQRGRCRACDMPIGWREPLVELGASLLAVVAVWRFGTTLDGLLAATCLWLLLLAAVIDIERGWLPGEITGPLLWLGLLASLGGGFALPDDAIIGAAAGYASLGLVRWAFHRLTGREGMGAGDLHLLAAIGAWVGWQALPGIILLAACLGLLWSAVAVVAYRRSHTEPMPFGPMLALAGTLALVWPGTLVDLLPAVMAV
jgi:leader peptidase (prepilin peptidase)/N-methyltransferase